MSRPRAVIAFVVFAVFLHGVQMICVAIVVQGWNPMGRDQISAGYGYLDPLFVWPKLACLAVAAVLATWPWWRKVGTAIRNDPDAPPR